MTQLVDLPSELIQHILDYLIITNPLLSRLETNIKNLCNFELISNKQFGSVRCFLEKYWKIILFYYIHVRSEVQQDGKEVVHLINLYNKWKMKHETLEKLKRKSYKRMFGLLREVEKRKIKMMIYKNNYSNGNRFKLCVCGPGQSGVCSFINRYLYDQFDNEHTLDEVFHRKIDFYENTQLELEIWESGIRNEYFMFHPCYESKLRGARGYIILFAVNSDASQYEILERIIRTIIYIHDDGSVPLTVCINQIDLLENDPTLNIELVKGKVIKLLQDFGFCRYEFIETSCKMNINIQTAMQKTIENGLFFDEIHKYYERRLLLDKIVKKDRKILETESTCSLS